jgi:processive 1,2-diacylglycerol beta-glucosyltransferase
MRVLIATVTAGGGHLAAAAALNEAWKAARGEDSVEVVDLLRFFSPLHRRLYAEGYVKLVERAPEVWGMMFKKTDNPRLIARLNRFKRLLPGKSRTKFVRYLRQLMPEVVLCTHYLPLEILGELRPGQKHAKIAADSATRRARAPEIDPLIVSIVTDFEAHALWMDSCVDVYCVAAEETKARLVARGADAEDVIATGIPIASKFSAKVDTGAVRSRMGLRDDQPVVLVLSGGFGMGPVADILAELDKIQRPFQTVVVAGRNEELRRELAACVRTHPTHVLGFTTNMHELMCVADVIVSKPGGLTTSESLAIGKPMFILNPIPGQEAANSDFLLEHSAAAKVNRVEDLPFRLEQLLGSKKLAEMSRAARALGRPQAAQAICRLALNRLSTVSPGK